jgi:hypothetical protein
LVQSPHFAKYGTKGSDKPNPVLMLELQIEGSYRGLLENVKTAKHPP